MIFLTLLFSFVISQPCTPPINLVDSTPVIGSCASSVTSTSSTDFLPAEMGGNSVNNGLNQFSITMWINPQAPTANGPTYSLFRVTMNAGDTTLSTTDGIRLALYLRTDANNYNNRGMNLGYAELPSTPQSFTDLSQFAFSYQGGSWIFIYAGLNYVSGEMSLFAWETTTDTPLYTLFQASKQAFNTPLQSSSLQLNLLYWGSFLQFCGNMMQVNWFPGYYEKQQNSIRKLPFYLANPTIKNIYYYAWDLQSAQQDSNRFSASSISHPSSPNFIGYNFISDAIRSYTLEAIKWDYSAASFTLSMHINFQVLPVSGNDLVIFQRQTSGSSNIIAYIFGRQPDGTIGLIVQIANKQYILASFQMVAASWYFFQVQIAFHLAITGQNNALAFYSLVGQDNSYSNNGFFVLPYSSVFGNSLGNGDINRIGSQNNIYPGQVYIRHVYFQSGFSIFTGNTDNKINCLSNCFIGQITQTASQNYCYICAPPTYLDTVGGTCVSKCPTNYYPIGLSTSYEVCSGCNTDLNYYVNIANQCIIAQCPNSYQELAEQCDDGNSVNNDGCSSTCILEIGFKCYAVQFQTTTCVKLCGNGVDDSSGPYVEQCDDGNTVNGDGCSSSCVIESNTYSCLPYFPTVCSILCGNGKLDQAAGQTEQCDDGNTANGDGCSSTCQIEPLYECTQVVNQLSSCNLLCGNGQRVGLTEECDDGNQVNNDGCTNCQIDKGYVCQGLTPDICTALCGNGVIDASNTLLVEHCDDGNGVPYDGCTSCQIDNGWNCYGGSPTHITTCENCGNGKREGQETCDDGNTIDDDGCTNCQIDVGWTCNGQSPDQCGNCGNGFKEQIEQCDDGNTDSNDGCTNCIIDAFYSCFGGSPTTKDTCVLQCPNGIVSGTETCDDNNSISSDGCTQCQVDNGYVCVGQPSSCTIDTCGNGLRNTLSEKCDDGNQKNDDGCDSSCQIETGWLCSGGGLTSKDTCRVICGDGIKITNVESCDDGNQVDGDGCSQKCIIEQGWNCAGGNVSSHDNCYLTCGNNVREGTEQCDDGNIRNGDGCSSICLIETNWGCEPLVIQILDQSTNKIVPVVTKGDQCYQCVKNCAICSSDNIKGCSLCHQGYYLDYENNICSNKCKINTYPNAQTQTCSQCQDGCLNCFDSKNCYKCAEGKVLNATKCVNLCSYGWFNKSSDQKGQWCKKCPSTCSSCVNETACLTCIDHFSLSRGQCVACNLGGLCLQCDIQNEVCTSCILGYRPVGKECIKIPEICGDGFKSSLEQCDDGNNLNDDGCSRSCKIEPQFGCHLVKNEGPSICFNIDGWKITLTTFILEPTRVRITFSDQVQYDYNFYDGYDKLFNVTILSFKWNEFNVSYGNISNTTIDMFFDFKKNVISQTLTLKLKQKNVLHNVYGVGASKDYYSITIKLEDVEYYSDSQIDAFNLYTKVIMGLQYYQWLMVVSGGFLGSNQKLWKIVEVMQVTAILQFVNVPSYPLNLQTIINQFQDSIFYLGENPLTQNSEDSALNLRRFMYARLTYYCLNNSGGRFILAVAITLGFYILLKLIYNRFVFNLLQVFLDKFEYSFFFKLYEVFLLDLMLGCINNIYFNSMNSNWEGTNTVVAFMLMSFVGLVQIGSMIIAIFYEKFGTKKEIELMFGTLFDGTNSDSRWRRAIVSQQDFARKLVIAYGLISQSDPAAQLYMIMLPRAIILVFTMALKIYKDPIVIFRELITESLFQATLGLLYQYSTTTYVDDLQSKVDAGWKIVFIILSNICFNGAINTYIIWDTLKELELTLPDNGEKVNLNKGVDLFKLKKEKKVKQEEQIKQADLDIDEQEKRAIQDKKINDLLNLKNADREKWNVWDMDRDARPEEQRFVSILHDNRRAISQEQQRQSSKQPSDQLQSHHSEEEQEDHSHHDKQSVDSKKNQQEDGIDPFAEW